jgi:hypothetical protein
VLLVAGEVTGQVLLLVLLRDSMEFRMQT